MGRSAHTRRRPAHDFHHHASDAAHQREEDHDDWALGSRRRDGEGLPWGQAAGKCPTDRRYLDFDEAFLRRFVDQRRDELRTLDETLEAPGGCCSPWPRSARHAAVRAAGRARRGAGVNAVAPSVLRPGGRAGSICCTAWPSPRAEPTCWRRSFVSCARNTSVSYRPRRPARPPGGSGWGGRDLVVARARPERGARPVLGGGRSRSGGRHRPLVRVHGGAPPSGISCTVPARPTSAATPGNTALVHAEAAYRQAVRTATDHGCARAAARIVGAEVASTSRRVRALRRHWIPRPQEALAHVDLALEQSEHEDSVRRRWAAQVLKGMERPTERDGPSEDRSARR
ncbi:hypothetical protein O1M63_10005 [Streptomyces mirabilis]|nr:hypothetical protein [Streptomyces mirabilis]